MVFCCIFTRGDAPPLFKYLAEIKGAFKAQPVRHLVDFHVLPKSMLLAFMILAWEIYSGVADLTVFLKIKCR